MTQTLSKAADNPASPLLLRALKGEVTDRVPFWLMRQAGRYLPEYRALRAEAGSFLKLCYTPDMASEVTLQPMRRFGMDAAIIFSDILVVPHGLGRHLTFAEGEGPRLDPVRTVADILSLRVENIAAHVQPLCQALTQTRAALNPAQALIGFVGAPWTVACYMVDGRGGDFPRARQMAAEAPDVFAKLIEVITDASIISLKAQIAAGADAVQIFDSWAGLCQPVDIARFVIEPTQKITAAIKETYADTPVIGFPRHAAAHYHSYAAQTGIHALGIDQNADMAMAAKTLPASLCLQGNLDPEVLLAGGPRLRAEALRILETCHARPHVFNLGHGVIKETPPDHVAELAALIKGYQR